MSGSDISERTIQKGQQYSLFIRGRAIWKRTFKTGSVDEKRNCKEIRRRENSTLGNLWRAAMRFYYDRDRWTSPKKSRVAKLQHLVSKSMTVNSVAWENLMRKHVILQALRTCFCFNLWLDWSLLVTCGCRGRWRHWKTLTCIITSAWRVKKTQKATDASQSHRYFEMQPCQSLLSTIHTKFVKARWP